MCRVQDGTQGLAQAGQNADLCPLCLILNWFQTPGGKESHVAFPSSSLSPCVCLCSLHAQREGHLGGDAFQPEDGQLWCGGW